MSIRSLFLDALYPRRLTCDLCGRDPPGPIRAGRILLPGLPGKAAARFPFPRSVRLSGRGPGRAAL